MYFFNCANRKKDPWLTWFLPSFQLFKFWGNAILSGHLGLLKKMRPLYAPLHHSATNGHKPGFVRYLIIVWTVYTAKIRKGALFSGFCDSQRLSRATVVFAATGDAGRRAIGQALYVHTNQQPRASSRKPAAESQQQLNWSQGFKSTLESLISLFLSIPGGGDERLKDEEREKQV